MARFDMTGAGMAQTNSLGDTLFQLGMAASTGREGPADLVSAHKWFNLAALKGHEDAAAYRHEIALELSPAEVAEAQRAAREWIRTH
jgi:TPR repeat protein